MPLSRLMTGQINETMAHPDLVNLKIRCNAQRPALPGGWQTPERSPDRGLIGFAEYDRLRRDFGSLRKTLTNEKYEQV